MELSLGEGEPVSYLVSCEHWEVDSQSSDRNGGGGGQGGFGSEGFFERVRIALVQTLFLVEGINKAGCSFRNKENKTWSLFGKENVEKKA